MVVMGLIATLAALVLGLLVASAKTSFDTANEAFRQSAAKVILLDRALAQYGPESKALRELIRQTVATRLEQLFSKDGSQRSTLSSSPTTAAFEGVQQHHHSCDVVLGVASLAAALFLIEELYDPFGGVISIPSAPMHKAIAILGQ